MNVDLLALLDAFVKKDASPPGILGEVAVGIQRGEGARWWRASFGAQTITETSDRYPQKADSILLLDEADAEAIVKSGAPREQNRAIYFRGDKQLMKRFLERYLSGEARTA